VKEKVIFCWSGGKDSALALFYVLQENKYEVSYLLTTLHSAFHRISMHGVKEELLEQQAASIGIPLIKMFVKEGTNEEYEQNMSELLLKQKREEGISTCIFGDIFLDDLRAYRENNLAKAGYKGIFPLWKRDTKELISEFLELGFKTITCCVYDKYLGEEWCGRLLDDNFLAQLPPRVDPCGENGEFHTFCFAGPLFKKELNVRAGEKVYRAMELRKDEKENKKEGFWFCEIERIS
jgi:uncharacterized protein (TIGR00290 family)